LSRIWAKRYRGFAWGRPLSANRKLGPSPLRTVASNAKLPLDPLYERGFIVAAEGNLSVRLDNRRLLTTPTCMNKGKLGPEDLVITDLEGRQLGGTRKASSELAMHLLFYRMRPEVNAICHAHPPTATGFATAPRGLDRALLAEVVVWAWANSPRTLRYTRYTGVECGARAVRSSLRRFTPGESRRGDVRTGSPYRFLPRHAAKITLAAEMAGEPVLLSSREVAKLMAARARYFVSPPGGGGGLPITSDSGGVSEDRVTLTRNKLDILIEEAVRKNRARK
jgi:L-fuculose-phosphate aldolase